MTSSAGSPCWLSMSIIETVAPALIRAEAARMARTSSLASRNTCIHTVINNVCSGITCAVLTPVEVAFFIILCLPVLVDGPVWLSGVAGDGDPDRFAVLRKDRTIQEK